MTLSLLTNYPKHYLIEYSDFDEIFKDYTKLSKQMEFIETMNSELRTDIEMLIGDEEYLLSVKIWKI